MISKYETQTAEILKIEAQFFPSSTFGQQSMQHHSTLQQIPLGTRQETEHKNPSLSHHAAPNFCLRPGNVG